MDNLGMVEPFRSGQEQNFSFERAPRDEMLGVELFASHLFNDMGSRIPL